MVSTVRTRPNHYETLGLKPTASDEEIAQAFARAMRLPHRVAEVAQIGIAFDTLRNPAKRRAHDEALGLKREAEVQVVPSAMSFRASAHFAAMSLQRIEPEIQAAPKPALPLRREVPLQPQAERQPERAAEPVKIDLLADLARAAERERKGQPSEDSWLEPPIPDFLATGRTSRARDADERAIDWKQPLFAIGSLIVGVIVIGAWAGAHAQDVSEPKPAGPALTVALPAAKPASEPVPTAAAPAAAAAATVPFAAPHSRVRPMRAPAPTGDRLANISQSLATAAAPEVAGAESVGDQSVADARAAPAVEASLPLPKAVIARTIERIGYRCGDVASATAAGPGAYKITCTSGQSYQATPVRGRYRFRRL